MPYICERCQKEYDVVLKMAFQLGVSPQELNLCRTCVKEVIEFYKKYNIRAPRKVISVMRSPE